jgi:hypothetical protein
MDEYIERIDFDRNTAEQNDAAKKVLDDLWMKGEKTSRQLMLWRLSLVLIGIAAEIIFIVGNIKTIKSKDEKPAEVRIELPTSNNNAIVTIDTSAKSILQIKIQKP